MHLRAHLRSNLRKRTQDSFSKTERPITNSPFGKKSCGSLEAIPHKLVLVQLLTWIRNEVTFLILIFCTPPIYVIVPIKWKFEKHIQANYTCNRFAYFYVNRCLDI